ncbi:hypothetical protein MHU86_10345 [Fragilaria crotonensis]|nr:hypothetical protein MHU86_10345 [Fragilaria crotonensis]
MIERIRPESGTEIGASQHGAQSITDSLVRAFAGPFGETSQGHKFRRCGQQIIKTLGIGALLDHESEVDAKALKACGGGHGVGMAARCLAELGSHTNRALVDGVREAKRRHATSMLVEFGEPAKVQMTETLVPQHTEGGASKGMHSEKLVDSGSRAVLKLRRGGTNLGTETGWVANDDGQCAEGRNSDGQRVNHKTLGSAWQWGDVSICRRDEEESVKVRHLGDE